jgi:hypothetical protein
VTCVLTVGSLRYSSAAISVFERPRAMSPSTSRSRGVSAESTSGAGAPGGFPEPIPAGLSAFEAVALLLLIVGAVCLAIAIFRARILPVWIGVAVLLSLVCAFLLHGGPIVFVSDYLLLAALFAVGLRAARPTGPRTVR